MNVYECWYQGIRGYCCRSHNMRWLFIPDLGQLSSRIHKHVAIEDLIFANPFAKSYELSAELAHSGLVNKLASWITQLFFPVRRPATVGGLLFARI